MSFFKKLFGVKNSTSSKEKSNDTNREPNYPIKYHQDNVEIFKDYPSGGVGSPTICNFSKDLDKFLPSHTGPFKVNDLEQLLGKNFEIESMTGGIRDAYPEYNQINQFYLKRHEYLKEVGSKLYDELVKSNSVFTNYIHFGDDFYKFGLDRTHYITNIKNGKFYFTNELLTVLRSYLMQEVFTEKIKDVVDKLDLKVVENHIISLEEADEYDFYNPFWKDPSIKRESIPIITIKTIPPKHPDKYRNEKIVLFANKYKDMRSSEFIKKGTNLEISNRYNETNEIFKKMNLFNFKDDRYDRKRNYTYDLPKKSIDELLNFITPGIRLLYGEETEDKLRKIFDNIDIFNDSTDHRLLLPYALISLVEQFRVIYTTERKDCVYKDLYGIVIGSKGESTLSRYLELYDDEILILENLTIGFKNYTAECDSILITKFGIFVIECKNFGVSGNFKIKISKDGRWSRVFLDGNEEAIERSAFTQNTEHARILQRALKEQLGGKFNSRFNVKDFIVISNEKVEIDNDSDQTILRVSSIYNHISKSKPIISDEEFYLLKDAIIKSSVKSKEFEYIDYLDEYLHLLENTLSIFDSKGGFKNIVDRYYKAIPEIAKRKYNAIKDFCKVEAQLLYIYKNYDKDSNYARLSSKEDPFLNGEFESAANKLLKDLNSDRLALHHPERLNDNPILTPGEMKFLHTQLHSKLLKNYKSYAWDISERYFYPKVNKDNSIHWTDNYFAKFDDMYRPRFDRFFNITNRRYLDPNTTIEEVRGRFNRGYTPETAALLLIVLNRFSSYYFKPSHIYKNITQDLYKLQNIKLGSTISLGTSSVTLKEQPTYNKIVVFGITAENERFTEEAKLDKLAQKGEECLAEQDWFSMLYDRNVRFRLRGIYIYSKFIDCSIEEFNDYSAHLFGYWNTLFKETCYSGCRFRIHEALDDIDDKEFYFPDPYGVYSFTCKLD